MNANEKDRLKKCLQWRQAQAQTEEENNNRQQLRDEYIKSELDNRYDHTKRANSMQVGLGSSLKSMVQE